VYKYECGALTFIDTAGPGQTPPLKGGVTHPGSATQKVTYDPLESTTYRGGSGGSNDPPWPTVDPPPFLLGFSHIATKMSIFLSKKGWVRWVTPFSLTFSRGN